MSKESSLTSALNTSAASAKMFSPGNTSVDGNDDELELRYDPLLNCYFDPVTLRYYALT